MSLNNYFILGLSSIIVAWMHGMCYERLDNSSVKSMSKSLLIYFIFGLLFFFNNYLISSALSRVVVSVILITIMYKILFNNDIKETIAKSLLCYTLLVIIELLLSVVMINLNCNNIGEFNKSVLIKSIISFIELFLTIRVIENQRCNIELNKVVKASHEDKVVNVFLIISAITMILLVSKYENAFNMTTYSTNLILILLFTILMIISVKNNIKANKRNEKISTLLNFISKYEKIIDDDRINRHEMLNNLLLLKSFKNKSSIEYEETINDIIKLYERNGKETIRNISVLPSGIKGILYYKLEEMKNDGIDINVNISKRIKSNVDMLPSKDYASLCKLFGIILDNAYDAARESEEKSVFIDVFGIDENITISVENSYKGKMDLSKLNEQNYSTKGKGRGLGLFIASNIIKNTESLNMTQKLEGKYYATEINITVPINEEVE